MKLPDDDKPQQPHGQRPCMEDREYETWDFWNQRTQPAERAYSPCVDCTVDFSEEMATMGLCDGTPTVVIKSRHKGTSSGEKLSRREAQALRYSTELEPAKAARVHAHKAAWTPERRARMSRLMKERNNDPAWKNRKKGGQCLEDGCKKPLSSKGRCHRHYVAMLRQQKKEHDERM